MQDLNDTLIVGSEFPLKVIPLIERAKRTISIAVFDWRWYKTAPAGAVGQFTRAILDAKERGVAIRCIVNNDDIANALKAEGIKVHRVTTKGLVHLKLMLIDNEVAIIGSHNYTAQAFSINFETSVILEGVSFPVRIIKTFEDLWLL